MKTLALVLGALCLFCTTVFSAAPTISMLPKSSPAEPARLLLSWESEPGLIYSVQTSTNLKDWETVPGYPVQAAGDTSEYIGILDRPARFFRVLTPDPLAPSIVSVAPRSEMNRVSRTGAITIRFSELSSVDANSVQLSVGSLGDFSINSPEISFANGVLTFNATGRILLGTYGETVTTGLVVSSTAGEVTSASWAFQLEELSISDYFANFQYVPHRGIPLLYPEETLEAYRASVAAGATVVEADCQLLKDGNLGIMHDNTLDRTTTSSGSTLLQDATSWRNLVVDPSSFLGPEWPDTSPPLIDDLLEEFGNKQLLFLEPKNQRGGAAIAAKLKAYGISPAMVLINSFSAVELNAALSARYPAMLNFGSYSGVPTPAQLAATGYFGVCVPSSTEVHHMDALRTAGLRVLVYTIETQSELSRVRDHCDAVYADDPFYLMGSSRRTTDPFSMQSWYPGMHSNESGADARGRFFAPDYWGLDGSTENKWKGILQGWACPLGGGKATEGTISYSVTYGPAYQEDNTRLAWMALMTSDTPFTVDVGVTGREGYAFIARKNGTLEIIKYHYNGTAWNRTTIASKAGTEIPDGATATFTIRVSASRLVFVRTDVPTSVAVNDDSFRGVYLHSGVKGLFGKFSGISVNF